MSFRLESIAALLALGLAGCSVHPLPEDVMGLDTNHIVFHIRCEAGGAIWSAIGAFLAASPDPRDRTVGVQIRNGARPIGAFKLAELSPDAQAKIKKYLPAAMVLDFTFDMSEDNDLGASADVLDTFTHSVFSLGIRADADHQRQTIRQFRTSNTFDELIAPNNCVRDAGPNWNYPIAGTIGLSEMVRTFVDLNEFEGLSGKDAVPQLADTLVFQTNTSASLAPKITLNPVKLGARLSDAAIGPSAFRKDNHKVIVALSLPPLKGRFNYGGGLFFGQAVGSSSEQFARSPAVAAADRLADEQINRNIINTLAVRPFQ